MQDITGRQRCVPDITYPEDLPIAASRGEIARAIAEHQVVIIAGETGSGKTTQLPKICLEMGRGDTKLIGHTQPRRLAARTVAGRIAQELGTELGDLVGYQVRFNDQVSENTAIKLMTDGILLAEMRRDRLLRKYDTLFIDEGFGSLDTESLDLAIRTLIDLQASGRTIGIISHVSELKEQMALRLDVMSDRGGSHIATVGA